MSYDPSYRTPPRQERWPYATPQHGWPAYPGGDGYRDADQAREAAGAFADAGTGQTAGYGGTGGYRGADRYGDAWDGYAEAGHGGTGQAYAHPADSFDGGYGGTAYEYPGNGAGQRRDGSGYGAADVGYGAPGNGYDQAGYDEAWDDLQGAAVYSNRDEYAEPGPATRSGPLLIPPDTIGEQGWLPGPDDSPGHDRDRSGLVIGAVMGFLAAGVAIGVATLAAAFVRPQASPIIAVGGAFIDRTPPAVKNFAVQHFGENDKTVLLLGMYVTVACLAMAIGCLARRNVTIGVAGLAAFGLFGAFVAITRPESRATDVIPSVIGAIAGITALLWLARTAAPITPVRAPAATAGSRHARSSRRREVW